MYVSTSVWFSITELNVAVYFVYFIWPSPLGLIWLFRSVALLRLLWCSFILLRNPVACICACRMWFSLSPRVNHLVISWSVHYNQSCKNLPSLKKLKGLRWDGYQMLCTHLMFYCSLSSIADRAWKFRILKMEARSLEIAAAECVYYQFY